MLIKKELRKRLLRFKEGTYFIDETGELLYCCYPPYNGVLLRITLLARRVFLESSGKLGKTSYISCDLFTNDYKTLTESEALNYVTKKKS